MIRLRFKSKGKIGSRIGRAFLMDDIETEPNSKDLINISILNELSEDGDILFFKNFQVNFTPFILEDGKRLFDLYLSRKNWWILNYIIRPGDKFNLILENKGKPLQDYKGLTLSEEIDYSGPSGINFKNLSPSEMSEYNTLNLGRCIRIQEEKKVRFLEFSDKKECWVIDIENIED